MNSKHRLSQFTFLIFCIFNLNVFYSYANPDEVIRKAIKEEGFINHKMFSRNILCLEKDEVDTLIQMAESDRAKHIPKTSHKDERGSDTGITLVKTEEGKVIFSIPSESPYTKKYIEQSDADGFYKFITKHTDPENRILEKLGKRLLNIFGIKSLLLSVSTYCDEAETRRKLRYHEDRWYGSFFNPRILAFVVLKRESLCDKHIEGKHPKVFQLIGRTDKDNIDIYAKGGAYVLNYNNEEVKVVEAMEDEQDTGYLVDQDHTKHNQKLVHGRSERECKSKRITLILRGVDLGRVSPERYSEQLPKGIDSWGEQIKRIYLYDPRIAKELCRNHIIKTKGSTIDTRFLDDIPLDNIENTSETFYKLMANYHQ